MPKLSYFRNGRRLKAPLVKSGTGEIFGFTCQKLGILNEPESIGVPEALSSEYLAARTSIACQAGDSPTDLELSPS